MSLVIAILLYIPPFPVNHPIQLVSSRYLRSCQRADKLNKNVSLFVFSCCDNHLDQNNLEEDLGFIWLVFLCHSASLIEFQTRIQAGTEAEIIRNDAYCLTHRLMVLIQSRSICLRMVLPTEGLVISYQYSVKTIPPRPI